jgi:hypothetical protein
MSVRFYDKVQIGAMVSPQVIRLRFIDLGMQPSDGQTTEDVLIPTEIAPQIIKMLQDCLEAQRPKKQDELN